MSERACSLHILCVSDSSYNKVIECIQLINCCITYKNGVNVRFYNNYTCRFIVGICFVYMGDNTNYLISFLFNKTENVMYIKMYMSFYSENSLLLLYATRIKEVNQSNMKVNDLMKLLFSFLSPK